MKNSNYLSYCGKLIFAIAIFLIEQFSIPLFAMNKETLSLNYILNSGFRLVLGLVALYLCYRYYTYLLKKKIIHVSLTSRDLIRRILNLLF